MLVSRFLFSSGVLESQFDRTEDAASELKEDGDAGEVAVGLLQRN
jgi:hypothetical protein